jgi:hypothetical protein
MSEIACPSGLRVDVRGMKGKELRLFQDKKGTRDGSVLDQILGACVEQVIEPGIYKVGDDGKLSWCDVLLGDEFHLFVAIRRATFGDVFSFKVTCPGCAQKFEWDVNLAELPIKPLSEEAAATLKAGRLFETKLSDGRAVTFRLPTGGDEREVMKLKTAENPMVSMLAQMIDAIGDERDKTKIRRELEEAPLGDLMKMRKLFDDRDCGVETTIEVKCPAGLIGGVEYDGCGEVSEMTLPLGRTFLLGG